MGYCIINPWENRGFLVAVSSGFGMPNLHSILGYGQILQEKPLSGILPACCIYDPSQPAADCLCNSCRLAQQFIRRPQKRCCIGCVFQCRSGSWSIKRGGVELEAFTVLDQQIIDVAVRSLTYSLGVTVPRYRQREAVSSRC